MGEGKIKCQGCGKEIKDPAAHKYKNCRMRLKHEEIQKASTWDRLLRMLTYAWHTAQGLRDKMNEDYRSKMNHEEY